VDICLLALAEFMVTDTALLDQDAWLGLVDRVRILLEAYYEHYDELVVPPPYLDGNQLIQALKLQPGPIISTLIDLIREEQAVGTVRSAEDAIRVARTYLDEHT
jgi:tRNA nucleotidyltransferase (CCA-adding enzyme)